MHKLTNGYNHKYIDNITAFAVHMRRDKRLGSWTNLEGIVSENKREKERRGGGKGDVATWKLLTNRYFSWHESLGPRIRSPEGAKYCLDSRESLENPPRHPLAFRRHLSLHCDSYVVNWNTLKSRESCDLYFNFDLIRANLYSRKKSLGIQ